MSDPYFKNVVLLLTFNKEDSGASYLTDYSLDRNVVTAVGSPTNSTAQYKYDTSSLYLNGSNASLTIPTQPNFNLGSAEFTVEFWMYGTHNPGAGVVFGLIGQRYSDASNYSWIISTSGTTNSLLFEMSANGTSTALNVSGGNISINAWNHIALVRVGTVFKFYVNGTLAGTSGSTALPIFTNTGPFQIGVRNNSLPTSYPFRGYLADVRLTKGVARYTANFTPPASLKSLTFDALDMYYSYVALAIPCDSSVAGNPADYSRYKRGILQSGNPGLSNDRGKFDSTSYKFDGANYGEVSAGSMLAFGLGDYTVDFWIWMNYATPYAVAERILAPKTTTNQAGAFQIAIPGDGTIGGATFSVSLMGSLGTSYILTTSTAINDGQWHHVAICRCNANNLTYIFLDGVLKQSVLDVTNYTLFGTEGLKIGARADLGINNYFIGYLDELRITSGIARWVAGFTPPTASIKDLLPSYTFNPKVVKPVFNKGYNFQAESPKKTAKVLIKRKLGLNWQELDTNRKVVHQKTTKYSFAEWSSLSPNRKVRQSPRFLSSFKNVTNWGGTGIVSGVIEIGVVPVKRKVRLYDYLTGIMLQEKWSDVDGTYYFNGLRKDMLYTVTSTDVNDIYNDVIIARITAV